MSGRDDQKKDVKDPQKKIREVQERMEKMQKEGRSGRPGMPLGNESLTSRMARMEASGPPGRMIRTMKKLRTDVLEIKNYLKKISDILEVRRA